MLPRRGSEVSSWELERDLLIILKNEFPRVEEFSVRLGVIENNGVSSSNIFLSGGEVNLQ